MPLSGKEPAPGAGVPSASAATRDGRRVHLGALGAVAAVAVLVALIVLVLHRSDGSPLGITPVAPGADWQTYHDPLGLFTARIPANWTANASTGTASFGDRTGSATEITEMVALSDPALGDGSARFYVDAAPIRNDFERHWYCQGFSRTSGTFHGIPAQHFDDATWIFETVNAHFQVDVWIPGALEPPHSQPLHAASDPTPTPLPSEVVTADRMTLATILDAFQPTNASALACP